MRSRLQHIIDFIHRENIDTVFVVVVLLTLAGGAAISWLEPKVDFWAGVWWSIVTLTTVGYGDISPATPGGRVVAVLLMFLGIGLLGTLSAGLARLLIFKRLKEDRGMTEPDVDGHIIICEWNHRAEAVLGELRADPRTRGRDIVLIADLEQRPVDDGHLFFVAGKVCEETLRRARLDRAETVVVLGDDSVDPVTRDAKVVLTTLAIESLCPDVYTVVELIDKANEQHCRRARADEIIVAGELSSHLLASAAVSHGISRLAHELFSSRYGSDLVAVPLPAELRGRPFIDIMLRLKKERNITVVGVQQGQGGAMLANPEAHYVPADSDLLVVITAANRQRTG